MVLGIIALVALTPILIVISLWIWLEDGRPIIYRQRRVGRGGREFTIHKFRTMKVGSSGPAISSSSDARITRAGRWLRKSKLDELPQLIDVVRGRMSLVGPRPEVPEYVRLWPADVREVILSVRPGITDPVSLALRDEGELLATAPDPEAYYRTVLVPQKIAGYVKYVQTRSMGVDLIVLLRTVTSVLRP